MLDEVNRLVPQYGGITRERLSGAGLVWPCPDSQHPGTPILHAQDSRLLSGGRMVPVQYKPAAEEESPEYPFLLTTGRVAVHHNAGSMTRRSPSLLEREPELFVEINIGDAAKPQGIASGDEVTVTTPRARRLKQGTANGPGEAGSRVHALPFSGHEHPDQ